MFLYGRTQPHTVKWREIDDDFEIRERVEYFNCYGDAERYATKVKREKAGFIGDLRIEDERSGEIYNMQ